MNKEDTTSGGGIVKDVGSILKFLSFVPLKTFRLFAVLSVQSFTFVFGLILLVFNNILFFFDNYINAAPAFFNDVKNTLFSASIYAFAYSVGSLCSPFPLAVVFVTKYILRYKVNRVPLPPPILNDPAYGDHYHTTIEGIRLHYVSSGDRSKTIMLFLHGFPDFWFSWREQIKHYSQHYWTIAVDLRGYGDSEKLSGIDSYHLDKLVDDIRNLIQYLQREQAIIVAHDWGGLILYSFLLKYPEAVKTYITLNIAPPYAMKFNPRQLFKSWYIYFFQLPILPELFFETADLIAFERLYKEQGDEIVKAYKFTFSKPGAFTYPLNYYRANLPLLAKYITFGAAEKLSKKPLPPGLAIYSKNDNFVDYKSFNDRTESWGLKNHLLVGEDHFVHQKKPELVNKIINNFLGIAS